LLIIATPQGGYNMRGTQKFMQFSQNIKTTLTFEMRRDRMGSKTQLVMGVWAMANYFNVSWCTRRNPFIDIFNFKICAPDIYFPVNLTAIRLHQPGMYMIPGGDDDQPRSAYAPWNVISKIEQVAPGVVWGKEMALQWNKKIVNAARLLGAAKPWKRLPDRLYIAVHVRRGDIVNNKAYAHAWVSDEQFNFAISQIFRYCKRFKKKVEVHLFSEETPGYYWKKFQRIDKFHLAKHQKQTINAVKINIKDWIGFIDADVLLVGGIFSAVPALARDPPGAEGLPMTLYWEDKVGYFDRRSFMPSYWTTVKNITQQGA
jgi:hypothetical protein